MALIHYNSNLSFYQIGFCNLGSTCYFNAVCQSMLSCTSFIDIILKTNYAKIDNPVTKLFIELAKTNIDLTQKMDSAESSVISDINEIKNKINKYSSQIWEQMINKLCKKKEIPTHMFMQGQQCAAEGFQYLLESMDEFHEIENLFIHRYKSLIYCHKCNKCISDVECSYSLFEVESDLQSAQIDKFQKLHIKSTNMNDYLSRQSSYVEGFTCAKCKSTDEKYRMNVLVMAPEILVVLSKKYNKKNKLDIYTEFPDKMEFKGTRCIMKYEAVAQIEHVGGRHGGHYWAICRRKNGWFEMNDMSVTSSKFQPTKNTYIVFYHLV